MQVITNAAIYHRTKLMERGRAARFAACLQRNSRFAAVSVQESPTARSDRRFYVQYQPSNTARQLDLTQREMDARAERAQEQAAGYLIEPSDTGRFAWVCSPSGEVYETTEYSCDCPDHAYRGSAVGPCKHSLMLRNLRAAREAEFEAERERVEMEQFERRAYAQAQRARWDG